MVRVRTPIPSLHVFARSAQLESEHVWRFATEDTVFRRIVVFRFLMPVAAPERGPSVPALHSPLAYLSLPFPSEY